MAHALPLLPGALALLALAAAVTMAALARSALRHWWAQRAGRPYELPVAYAGTVLRASGAALAGAVLAVALWTTASGGSWEAAGGAGAQPAHSSPPRAAERAPSHPSHHPHPVGPPADPAARPPRTIAHPADGTLQRYADGTRVWLPPQYRYPGAADLDFPVVVAYAAPTQDPADLIDAFAAHTRRGLADPFVIVLPVHCGTPVPAAVTARYRVAPARSARGLLGLGADAPCAVREALAHPDRYGATAAVSGTYDRLTPPPADGTELLLATPSGEEAHAASALRLRDTLGHPDGVRILDGAGPPGRLLALVAGYFTEILDGPNHP